MVCKLCLEDVPLIKSHIIPNFMYKNLLGKSRKLVNINVRDLSEKKYQQSGYYDRDILCARCDNEVLGKPERYACNNIYADLVRGTSPTRQFYDANGEELPFIRFSKLDYNLTKLFFLGILWKAHLSRQPFFSEVDLGKKYAENIRQMLMKGDAGDDGRFEVVLVLNIVSDARPSKSVIGPRRIREDGNTCYIFHIDEIMYHYNVTEHNKQDIYGKGAIRKDGIMDIAIIGNGFGRDYFDSFLGTKILLRNNPMS